MTLETKSETAQLEPLHPLMRPNQVEEALEERERLQSQLNTTGKAPWEQASMEARRDAAQILKRMDRQFASQVPTPYAPEELDTAVSREKFLRDKWCEGMPTQPEMRRRPSGAVDKHRVWDARTKPSILEWKNIRLRLHAGGNIKDMPRDANDVANIEMFRPAGGPGELNMDNTQITPPSFYLPPAGSAQAVVFSEDDLVLLGELSPASRDRLIVMNNEDRVATMDVLRHFRSEAEPEIQEKPKSPLNRGSVRPYHKHKNEKN